MPSISRLLLSAVSAGAALLIAAPAAIGSGRAFTVQVLSVSDNTTAEKTKEALRQNGLDAYVEQHEGAFTTYRVRIGRFKNLKNAKQLKETLRLQHIESWIARTGAAEPAQTARAPAAKPHITEPTDARPAHDGNGRETPNGEPAASEQPQTARAPAAKPHTTEPADARPAHNGNGRETPNGEPAADTKLFELVINPVASFAEKPSAAASATTTTIRPCGPDKHYLYYNPQDRALHITAEERTIPKFLQKNLRQIIIYPASYKRLHLRDMTMQVAVENKDVVLAFDGITQARHTPPPQAVLDFKSVLQENPLRILYYPPRTDPDGTLHGALFFNNGVSVGDEMVRLGLAAFQDRQLPP